MLDLDLFVPVIPEEKLGGYLLDLTHEHGKSTANFFFIWRVTEAEVLRRILFAVWNAMENVEILKTAYGRKAIVKGKAIFPGGRIASLKTVWMLEEIEG